MEERKTFSRYGLIFKSIAVILIAAIMFNFTFSAYAAEEAKKYVREIIIVTAPTFEKAQEEAKKASDATIDEKHPEKKRDFEVFGTPIYTSDQTTTWLCYATTTNRNLAVTSIKAMNMRGPWSYEEYNSYLDGLEGKAKLLVKDLLVAVREYNTNLAAKYPRATQSKTLLDMLIVDDSVKEDGSAQTVAEFFYDMGTEPSTDTAEEQKCIDKMTTLAMEANVTALCSIENALLTACADTYEQNNDMKGHTLFDGLEEGIFLAGVNGYSTYTDYDTYADAIIESLPDLQKDLFFYSGNEIKYTPEMEELAKLVEDAIFDKGKSENKSEEEIAKTFSEDVTEMLTAIANEEDFEDMEFTEEQSYTASDLLEFYDYFSGLSAEQQQSYSNGRLFDKVFSGCGYTGYTGEDGKPQCANLYNLMTKFDLNDPNVDENNYKRSDFYPIIHLMSPGQRALLRLGFSEFVASVVNNAETLKMNKEVMLATVNSHLEDGQKPITDKDPVSVYFGVDRTLFKKNDGIAMTSEAISACKNVPLSPDQAYYQREEQIANYIMIASGASIAVTTATIIGYTLRMQAVLGSLTATSAEMGITGSTRAVAGVSIWIFATEGTATGQVAKTTQILQKGAVELVKLTEVAGKNAAFKFGHYLKAFLCSGGVGTFLAIFNALSIAAFLIALLVKLVAAEKAAKADTPYIDIPRVMCSYEQKYDPKADGGLSDKYDYIYYYGAKNPCLEKKDQERAANVGDTKGNKTNILTHRIGDVANWTLHGADRQWVALYAANDLRAGDPILAGEFMVTSDPLSIGNGYVSVKRFNEGAPYDLHEFYATTLKDSSIEERYLGYKTDNSRSSSQGASVFSKVTPIGMLAVGAVAGGGLGTLITYLVTKKRKKAKTAEG